MPDNKLDIIDKITSLVERALNMLFIRNPTKTSLGVLLGVILHTIVDNLIRITKVTLTFPIYFWIALSVFALHFRSLFTHHAIDEELETQMHYIEEVQKKGHFTEREKRQQWRNYISRVYEKASESMDNHNNGQPVKDTDRTATQ